MNKFYQTINKKMLQLRIDADNGYLLGNEMKYCPFCGAKMEEEQ